MIRLVGKNAIVTGAGSGIGRACAERLAELGAAVLLAEIDATRGRQTAEGLEARGHRVRFARVDVSQEADVQAMIRACVEAFGSLDVLVNNAGINFAKPLLETTLADWERVMGVDLKGVFLGCRYGIEQMLRQGRGGSIINISSVHSVQTLPGAAIYAAAKGGVTQLTRGLAIEFGAQGIRVNAVCPGLTATQIWQDLLATHPQREALDAHWRRNIALRRPAEPREIAELVAWLASDAASYVTGANLLVDGGLTAMLTSFEA